MQTNPTSNAAIILLLELDEQGNLVGIQSTDPIRVILRAKTNTGDQTWSLEDVAPSNEGPFNQERLALGRTLTNGPNGYEITSKGVVWRIDQNIKGWQAYDEKGNQLPFADPSNYSIPNPDVMKQAETFIKERRKGGAVPT